ncbi:MAG: nuclear transport factor 2 family protein [Myxococcota bacterium]
MEDEIRDAEERLRAAMSSSDVAALDVLIDERLMFVVPNGAVLGKADDLAAHRSGVMRFTRLELVEVQIEAHGSTAIAVVRADMAGTAFGQPFSGVHRYVRTWVRSERGWRVVGGSVSLVT